MTPPEMTPIEQAVYAAAFVDAFREMFAEHPTEDRTRYSKVEAAFVLKCFRGRQDR